MNREIKFSRRYETPLGVFETATIKEPKYSDVFIDQLGAPFEFQMSAIGLPVRVIHPEVIDRYLQRLVVSPEYGALADIAAVDAMKLQEAVLGFFLGSTD